MAPGVGRGGRAWLTCGAVQPPEETPARVPCSTHLLRESASPLSSCTCIMVPTASLRVLRGPGGWSPFSPPHLRSKRPHKTKG